MGTPSWSTWTGLPGITTNVGVSAITSSIISGIENTVVAAADETNTVQVNTYANRAWAGWTPVPGVQTSATPLLTQDSTGTTLSLYVAAVDEQVYVNSTTVANTIGSLFARRGVRWLREQGGTPSRERQQNENQRQSGFAAMTGFHYRLSENTTIPELVIDQTRQPHPAPGPPVS
jgi:hypothetical protein